MSDDRPTCRTCPHWLDLDDKATDADDSLGWCLRYPPVPVALAPDCFRERTIILSQHPETEGLDSCGEHPDFSAWLARRGVNSTAGGLSESPPAA